MGQKDEDQFDIEKSFSEEGKELYDNVMDEIDERIHIKKIKGKDSDKTIIREVGGEGERLQDQPGSSSSKKGKYRYIEYEDENGKKVKIRRPIEEEIEEEKPPEKRTHATFSLQVSKNQLEAYLLVHRRPEGAYRVQEIMDFLASQDISYGIDEKMVQKIADGECYYEDVKIASGIAPKDGRDGYFEFHFNTDPEMKPIVLPDGSVDYNTLGKMELINSDQLLVTYHPATPCRDGKDVHGNLLKALESKDLLPLKGKGFELDEETMEYYSTLEGKVTYEEGSLNVEPVYILQGNLEAATGDLKFNGDVVIEGNVYSNVVLKTTGNITVNGHVEIATLIAGKDVLLKNGMQGSGQGRIYARGNVMAKFLEQTNVVAKGNISANAILNCNVDAGKSVIVSGTRGAILGGRVSAVEEIQAFTLGNRVGIATRIIIGLEDDFKTTMSKLDAQIAECREKLDDAERNYNRVSSQLKNTRTPNLIADQRKYLQEKTTYQNAFKRLMDRKDAVADIRERSVKGKVVVKGTVNVGTAVTINGVTEAPTSERKNVTFRRGLKELKVLANEIEESKPGLR